MDDPDPPPRPEPGPDSPLDTLGPGRDWFEMLNEIGIIAQLSRTLMESRLPEGMALPHFSVLNHCVRLGDGRTPLDLARAFQVPKTTMTHTLAVLEARGLIVMDPNPKDGRGKLVRLTPAGRALRETAIARLAPATARLAAAAGEPLPDQLLAGLRRLRVLLDRDRDA